MYSYCLFCETQKCERIAHIIQHVYGIRCISPRIIQRKWVKGQCLEEPHPWLPGYIFLYAEEPIVPSFCVTGIIRWLEHSELTGRDRLFAETLYRQDGVMGTVRLAQVGDRCQVDDPVWKSIHGSIVKIDRSRKRCCLEFEFAKTKRTVWVGYDMVKPEKGEDPCPSDRHST
ncbi:MAG: hypothetical protein IKN04_15650 [Clostridia bacterium]|nr:hypothetical protein [Clostridia bacterium]